MLSATQLLDALLERACAVSETETVAVTRALGRVLAAPQISAITVPPLDNSAMDGYAVRVADVARAGVRLPVSQRILAGHRRRAACARQCRAHLHRRAGAAGRGRGADAGRLQQPTATRSSSTRSRGRARTSAARAKTSPAARKSWPPAPASARPKWDWPRRSGCPAAGVAPSQSRVLLHRRRTGHPRPATPAGANLQLQPLYLERTVEWPRLRVDRPRHRARHAGGNRNGAGRRGRHGRCGHHQRRRLGGRGRLRESGGRKARHASRCGKSR